MEDLFIFVFYTVPYTLLFEIVFPFNLLIVIALVLGGYRFYKYMKEEPHLNWLRSELEGDDDDESEFVFMVSDSLYFGIFKENNPDFDEVIFQGKIKLAFRLLMEAWQKQELSAVRRFISDALYQQFSTQFKMMKLMAMENSLSDFEIKRLNIDMIETDGFYDIIHVKLQAGVRSSWKSSVYRGLDGSGNENYVEYWTFIKRREVVERDIYSTMNCPHCGALLPQDGGELSQCSFCKTIVNSGEYDWVLSEICQSDDYVLKAPFVAGDDDSLGRKVGLLVRSNHDISAQYIEDRAANGYLQILTAIILKKPELMRRFISDKLFTRLKSRNLGEGSFAYKRLYLNSVRLIGMERQEAKNIVAVAITFSFQRVRLEGVEAITIDRVVESCTEILLLSRDIGAAQPEGMLYAHSCPACGGAIEDSIEINCSFCHTELNSTANEWIISDVMKVEDYKVAGKAHSDMDGIDSLETLIENLYTVRDYALNNILILFTADGQLGEAEEALARRIAKKWGFIDKSVDLLLNMAKNGRLSLRMPSEQKMVREVYKLMEKAALIDGERDRKESELLEEVVGKYFYY